MSTTTPPAPSSGPSLLDKTTLLSLASTLFLLLTALALSHLVLPPQQTTRPRLRALFVWHAFDALIHFVLEGSFVYHCLFTSARIDTLQGFFFSSPLGKGGYVADPVNFLGGGGEGGGGWKVAHGAQAGVVRAAAAAAAAGEGASGGGGIGGMMAGLWMVYARADSRWAGVDLTVLSLEILTVVFGGTMACLVCYDIAKKNPRANLGMVILATAELYGGYMTFMPEWLTGSVNLDTSNFMYKWIFLIFFNALWVVMPLYAIYVAADDISDAFRARATALGEKKAK